MLVITRKLNEKLQIGDDIIVHVDSIREDNVCLIITLPGGKEKREVVSANREIQVTEDVVIRATVIQGKSKVRLGITAPDSMAIKRIPKS